MDLCPLNTFLHFIKSGTTQVEIVLLISAAIAGERIPTASFNFLGPIQASPVALEGSSDEIYDKIWPFVV